MRHTPRARWTLLAAVSGIISAGAFLAIAELTALLVVRGASPLEAVAHRLFGAAPRTDGAS